MLEPAMTLRSLPEQASITVSGNLIYFAYETGFKKFQFLEKKSTFTKY